MSTKNGDRKKNGNNNKRTTGNRQTNKQKTHWVPRNGVSSESIVQRERESVSSSISNHISVIAFIPIFGCSLTPQSIKCTLFSQWKSNSYMEMGDTHIYTPGDRGNALTSRNWRKRKSGGDSDREPLTDTFGHNNYECVHSLYYKAKGTFYNLL